MRTTSLLIAVLVAGCATTTGPEPGITVAVTPSLDQPFQLQVGERAFIEEAGFYLRFIEVVADSRCPSNALILCVWEGDGAILVEVAPVEGDALTDILHTTLDPKTLELGTHVLQLEQLDPYPETTDPIPPEEYAATFVVRRL